MAMPSDTSAAVGLRRRPRQALQPGGPLPSLSAEAIGPGPLSPAQVAALQRKRGVRRFKSLLHVLAWLGVAWFVLVQTQFFDVLLYDSRVGQVPKFLGVGFSLAFSVILFYMVVIVPIREGTELIDYNEMTPRAVYAALLCWIGAGLCLCTAVWPVWGWFSPVLITILGVALTLSTRLVPSCGWCSRRLFPKGSGPQGRGRYARLPQQDPEDAAEADDNRDW